MEININKCKVIWKPPSLPIICFEVPKNNDLNDFKRLENKSLDGYVLTVKKKRRSLNANAYMWVLCGKIADKIKVTKEDVYKHAVREVGKWVDMVVKPDKSDEAVKCWEINGIGWFAEPLLKGVHSVSLRFYKGSSVYNGEEMNRLIDYVVDEAQNLDIDTISPNEIERLKQLWETTDT